MRLIIDIPEETKKNIGFYGLSLNPRDKENLVNSIKNGIPYEDKPQGEWIEDEQQIHVEKTYHCSNCGYEAWGEDEKTPFCPICGTKMGKEQG